MDETKGLAEPLERALEHLRAGSCMEFLEAVETLLIYTTNLILYPDERKYRKVKISNIHYQERLGRLPGAKAAMRAIGYAEQGDFLRLDEAQMKDPVNPARLKAMEHLLNTHRIQMRKEFAAMPPRLPPTHVYTSVSGAGCHSEIGKRATMEDDEIIIDNFCGVDGQGFFGLYDGHGGRETVDFVVKVLHLNLQHLLKCNPSRSWLEALRDAYLITDGQIRRQNILRSGTTSVTCVVTRNAENKRVLYTANVGDSRAVLCRGGKAIRLTIDHKASLPEERKRIVEAGGFVSSNNRVNSVLAISRALGDHMLKEVVSAVPYCTETELTEEDTFLLLACDGLWDVMSDQDAIDFMLAKVKSLTAEADAKAAEGSAAAFGTASTAMPTSPAEGERKPPPSLNDLLEAVSKALVKEALDRRSQDNITTMVIKL